jgi:hypothetical protein
MNLRTFWFWLRTSELVLKEKETFSFWEHMIFIPKPGSYFFPSILYMYAKSVGKLKGWIACPRESEHTKSCK